MTFKIKPASILFSLYYFVWIRLKKQAILRMCITLESVPENNQYWAMRVRFLAQGNNGNLWCSLNSRPADIHWFMSYSQHHIVHLKNCLNFLAQWNTGNLDGVQTHVSQASSTSQLPEPLRLTLPSPIYATYVTRNCLSHFSTWNVTRRIRWTYPDDRHFFLL